MVLRALTLLCSTILLLGMVACRVELDTLTSSASYTTNRGNNHPSSTRAQLLQEALERGVYFSSPLRSGKIEEQSPKLYIEGIEPQWSRAQTFSSSRGATILRVPMLAELHRGRVAEGMTPEQDSLYAEASITYLVRVEDEQHPQGRNYMIHLVPTLEFLETGVALSDTSSFIPRGFDGEIEIYGLDGTLLAMEVYTKGARTQYNPASSHKEGQLRSVTADQFCYDVRTRYSYGTLDNGEVVCVGAWKLERVCLDSPLRPSSEPGLSLPQPAIDRIQEEEGRQPRGGGSYNPPPPEEDPKISKQRRQVNEALRTQAVNQRLDEFRASMKQEDIKTDGSMRERGVVVYQTQEGKIILGKTRIGSFSSRVGTSSTRVGVNLDTKIENNRDNDHPIPKGATPIAIIHTHPPYTYRSHDVAREVGFSKADSALSKQTNLPMIVLDYQGEELKVERLQDSIIRGVKGGQSATDSIVVYVLYPHQVQQNNKKK